jgi:hypothetical protein
MGQNVSRPIFKEPTARTILTREMALTLNAEEWEQAQGIMATMLKAQEAAQPLEWELEANGKLNPLDAETLTNLRESIVMGNDGLAILVMKATARRQLPKQN